MLFLFGLVILSTSSVEAHSLKALATVACQQSTRDITGTVYYVDTEGDREVYTANIENLCTMVSQETGLDKNYIKAIALRMAPTYISREPDVLKEVSLKQLTELEVVKLPTLKENGEYRGSEFYLPDALYTVSLKLKDIVAEREKVAQGRKEMQELYEDARRQVIFYEAFEQLYSKDPMPLDNIVKIYLDLLKEKGKDEYVVDIADNGAFTIADKFKPIFGKYGIGNTAILAQAMSLDSKLMHAANEFEAREVHSPYINGKTTRENMLIAGCGLVGKVRYVWGGGHGVHSIKGYSPIWFVFNDKYEGHEDMDISPDGSWCPIHGSTGNCSSQGEHIRTVSDYRYARKDVFGDSKFWPEIEKNLSDVYPDEIITTWGIEIHRLEGLDCSGFCSWLYNQIDGTRVYDSSAANFISSGGLSPVSSDDLKPGDIAAWSSHVVTILGKAKPNVYIVMESTTPTVRLGVYYLSGAVSNDIKYAQNLANKYNHVLGGDDVGDYVSRLNFSSLGARFGRLPYPFEDEDTKVCNDKTITEMSAEEILDYVVSKMPSQYLWGIENYTAKDKDSMEVVVNEP